MSNGKRFQRPGGPGRKDFSRRDDHDGSKVKLGLLPDNVMSYYRNVSTSLETGFDDEDPTVKDNFLNNVYSTLKDEGIQVSQNQTVSRILEVLFTHSKPHHMKDLFCKFSDNLAIVTFDRFASHVFQALIQHLPAIYEDKSPAGNTDGDKTSSVRASIEQLCKFAESHMRDVMTHTYASHVLRSLLEALGGVKVKEEVVRSRISRVHSKEKTSNLMDLSCKSLSRDFQQSFSVLREKIVHLCNFEDHLSDPSYCPVLQTLLLILQKTSPEEYRSLVILILEKSCVSPDLEETDVDNVSQRLPFIVQNEVGSYLIELIISLASAEELRELYDRIFKGKLIYFAVHPIANYVLQKLLSVILDPVMMKELLTDITRYLEDILAVNHVGIITKLAQACRNTQTGQDDLIQALLTAFHCQEPVEKQTKIVPLVASLQTFENFFSNQEASSESPGNLLKTVNIHGSLLLQELLQIAKPKLVVSSLLSLSPAELMGLCCDKCGSHIVDTFFRSQTVKDSNKFAFLKKLEGLYVNIACNKNGSRCLESIWKGSALKAKILIAEELSKSQDRIESDQWGHFLNRNFALFKFSQRRKEWMEIQGASTKKQQLLNDILQGRGRKNRKKEPEERTGRKNRKKESKEATLINKAVTELSVPGVTKVSKKWPVKDMEVESVSATTQMEGKQRKKNKSNPSIEATSTVSDANVLDQTEGKLRKKKSNPSIEATSTLSDANVLDQMEGKLRKKKSNPSIEATSTVSDANVLDQMEGKLRKKKSNPSIEATSTLSDANVLDQMEGKLRKKKSNPSIEATSTLSDANVLDQMEGKLRKKKSNPSIEATSTLSDANVLDQTDNENLTKKKRKRNKEKRRVVRNADVVTTEMEEKRQKKKSNPSIESTSTVSDANVLDQTDNESLTKKRNKEKRKVRNADVENSTNRTECGTNDAEDKPPKKKKKKL